MRRRIVVFLTALMAFFGLGLVGASSASADSTLCNVSFGLYCGRVYVPRSSEGPVWVEANGRGYNIWPGQSSRGLGIRDVNRVYSQCDSKVRLSALGWSSRTVRPCTWSYLPDSDKTWTAVRDIWWK